MNRKLNINERINLRSNLPPSSFRFIASNVLESKWLFSDRMVRYPSREVKACPYDPMQLFR